MNFRIQDNQVVTLKNIEKVASLRGSRDGKAEKPGLTWGAGSVPFITQALALFSAEAERRIANARNRLTARIYESLERDEQIDLLTSQLGLLQDSLKEAGKREDHFKNEIDGYKEENPIGRFARAKLIGDKIYLFVLVVLAIGEIFVTLPALVNLFGSGKTESYIIGIAVGVLPVAGAHITGIFLKSRLDRQRPQEPWLKNFYIAIFALVVSAIIALGILRAGITEGKLQDFTIIGANHTKPYLICFFIFLQLAFFAVAVGLSFMHFSPSAEAHNRAKSELKAISKEDKEIRKSLASYKAKTSISNDEVDATIKTLTSEIEILKREYEVAVAIYREANIHSRRDEIDGSHLALQAPPIEIEFLDKFEDFYSR